MERERRKEKTSNEDEKSSNLSSLTKDHLPTDQVDKVLGMFDNGLFSGWDVNKKRELELYAEGF